MTAPEGYVYVSVREYLGIDMPGQIAVPVSEFEQEAKEDAKNGE